VHALEANVVHVGVLHSCLRLLMHKAISMSLKYKNLLRAEHDPEERTFREEVGPWTWVQLTVDG
jgi:hypothetical protein